MDLPFAQKPGINSGSLPFCTLCIYTRAISTTFAQSCLLIHPHGLQCHYSSSSSHHLTSPPVHFPCLPIHLPTAIQINCVLFLYDIACSKFFKNSFSLPNTVEMVFITHCPSIFYSHLTLVVFNYHDLPKPPHTAKTLQYSSFSNNALLC